ncbi:MAG: hypothetical protein HQ526_05620 [Actinobacteria bacterium]|nr:hypothetical protein [Actinomycetota bacterium]
MNYKCGSTGDGEIAAVEVEPGPIVRFFEVVNGEWQVVDTDTICGGASAGLPPELLDFCSIKQLR